MRKFCARQAAKYGQEFGSKLLGWSSPVLFLSAIEMLTMTQGFFATGGLLFGCRVGKISIAGVAMPDTEQLRRHDARSDFRRDGQR